MKKLRTELLPLAFILSLLGVGSPSNAMIINGHDWELNLEYRQLTADNPPFSRHVYVCDTVIPGNCEDIAVWDALTPEAGWEVAVSRVRLFDSGTVTLPTPPAGLTAVLEFGGHTLNYTAEVIDGAIIDILGPFVIASVARDTVLTYSAGTVVHEVTDPDGYRYTLFVADTSLAAAHDLTMEGALVSLGLPSGWTYSSRTLAEDFSIDSGGLAMVFSAPYGTLPAFERWR
jgi:hypothetical protein